MDIVDSPMLTACGHAFCANCISSSLNERYRCPLCNAILTYEMIYPCFPLKSIADRIRQVKQVRSNLATSSSHGSNKINLFRQLLSKCKISKDEAHGTLRLLGLKGVAANREEHSTVRRNSVGQDIALAMTFMTVVCGNKWSASVGPSEPSSRSDWKASSWSRCVSMMNKLKVPLIETCMVQQAATDGVDSVPLKRLTAALQKVVKYDGVIELSRWEVGLEDGQSRIITSVAQSNITDLTALASAGRQIRVFHMTGDWDTYDIRVVVDRGFNTAYKPSCVRWSSGNESLLVFADYGGYVHTVDIAREDCDFLSRFQAHRGKCWAIDTHPWYPKIIVSASEDNTAKIIDIDYARPVLRIPLSCACSSCGFMPFPDRKMVTLGLADHVALVYDLRNISRPLLAPVVHNGPVAYAMFLTRHEILTSSAASEVRVTSLLDGVCTMRMSSHENRKYFVGLAHNDDGHILCGSETGRVYICAPELEVPILSHQASSRPTSALCATSRPDRFFCADRQGCVKLLGLRSIPRDRSALEGLQNSLLQASRCTSLEMGVDKQGHY